MKLHSIERDLYWDFCKSIAIIIVILGHCLQYFGNQNLMIRPSDNFLYRFIYSFHMPFFLFISGYFTNFHNESILNICKKKFFHLVLPTIVWSLIIYLCISLPFHLLKHDFLIMNFILSCLEYILNGFWFLKVLFLLTIAHSLSNIIFKNNIQVYLSTIILIYLIFLCRIPHGGGAVKYIYFFIAGCVFRDYPLFKKILFQKKTCLICLSIFCILYCINDENILAFYNVFTADHFNFKARIFQIFIGLFGSFTCLQVLFFIYNRSLNSKILYFLSLEGRKTLELYILQTVLIEFIISRFINFNINQYIYSFLVCPLASLLIYTILLVIIKYVESRNSLNKLLFCKF